nr:unnamed protein product [Callosobruchus chinensis]
MHTDNTISIELDLRDLDVDKLDDLYQFELYRALRDHLNFNEDKNELSTFDGQRRVAAMQALAHSSIKQLSLINNMHNLKIPSYATRIMMQVSPGSTIKYFVRDELFSTAIMNMGTERHMKFANDAQEGKIFGCYGLTEIAHSSNVRNMRCTATYNKQKKVFLLNTPDFEAAKCWVGGLGQMATHAIIYAMLVIDGHNYGLHAFVVPVRNPKTLLPYPGLTVGDMGEKIGLNGIDNGFIEFDNYEIPKDSLLNKLGDVTDDGKYTTPFKDPKKRHGAALGLLSGGRVNIGVVCETMGQHRLLPFLAAAYVFRNFNTYLSETFYHFTIDRMMGISNEDDPEKGMEIHALSSACKPVVSWTMRDAIQECRESCGGHGYLKAAGIGDIRNDHDANLTYEGENHILIQQCSNYLLKLWPQVLKRQAISSPLHSLDFLAHGLDILTKKFNAGSIEEICCTEKIIEVYQWLITYLLKISYEKLEGQLKSGKTEFWAKSESQVYYAKSLSIAYVQHFYLQRMLVLISEAPDEPIRQVLTRLFSLYGLWSLEKHIAFLYRGQYAVGPRLPELIHEGILRLCADIKDDAVSLIDAIAPPDFVLNSVLGTSDGMVGPLDFYRKKASFDWKKLKVFVETEDIVKYQEVLSSFDGQRKVASVQALAQRSMDQLALINTIHNLKKPPSATRIMMQVSPSSTIKYIVGDRLFISAIMNMGTKRHMKFINDMEEGKIFGCYALTEIAHGSNVRSMRCTATYDKQKKVFVLNTPDFEAAKCWAGGLGQLATHAVIYAMLVIDGHNYGLHSFVVPVRNPKTLLPYPGVIVGDMGEKIGLNGIDNGFVQFENYEIPKDNLLNKLGDVTDDGQYTTPFKDPNKRHGAALGSLSAGRVVIAIICETLGVKALTIAIRYGGVRRQFGPDEKTEQHRLIPFLAAVYVIRNFNTYLSEVFYQFSIDRMMGVESEDSPEKGMEIHALSSASKPVVGWTMRDAIQECRETCGGHGYLKAAGIGEIRNDHDANLTYEGENHVLIQQCSNYLLKLWPQVLKRQAIASPLHSIDFLTHGLDILSKKLNVTTIEEMCCPNRIIEMYQWLITYLLKISYEKLDGQQKSGKPAFWAKNDSQVYYAKSLAIAYIQHFYLQRMLVLISESTDEPIRNVLTRMFSLYALWSLEKHIPALYRGQYAMGPELPELLHEAILKMCADIKDDAVSLIDAIAPPDFVLNSVLGASDGMVYKHLEKSIKGSEYGMNRPKWWQDVVKFDLKNKL